LFYCEFNGINCNLKRLYSSLETMKKEVRQNLLELEKAKMVSSQNNYQIVISRIAQDIRNQRKHRARRQKELAHLQDVHKVLQKKHNLLKEQVLYYNEYVKACLDGFNSKKGGYETNYNNRRLKLFRYS
jgi:chromosome segregation ATPase